jgi:hypothetical protein
VAEADRPSAVSLTPLKFSHKIREASGDTTHQENGMDLGELLNGQNKDKKIS